MSSGSRINGVRTAQESSSGEYIAEDAAHWKAESFIPVTVREMKNLLLATLSEDKPVQEDLSRVFESLTAILNHDYRNHHQHLEAHYSVLDPDRDLKLVAQPTEAETTSALTHTVGYLGDVLRAANFTRLDHSEIREAMNAASEWGVRLHIDFKIFERMEVYARGDVVGIRTHRRWQDFYRQTEVSVPIYQRLVAIFKLKPDAKVMTQLQTGYEHDRLHLSMFKNIPKADVDMLLPGSNIKFSWLDRTKIFMPTLSGLGMTLIKILRGAVVIAATSLAAVLGVAFLVVGVIGYAIRSVFSYFHTHDKYLLNMTRSLYFQKLDSNAGVIYRLLQEARQQDLLEVIVAYWVLHNAKESLTQKQFRNECNRQVEEMVGVPIRFDSEDALERLMQLGLVIEAGGGAFDVLSPSAAMIALDKYWDAQISPNMATRTDI